MWKRGSMSGIKNRKQEGMHDGCEQKKKKKITMLMESILMLLFIRTFHHVQYAHSMQLFMLPLDNVETSLYPLKKISRSHECREAMNVCSHVTGIPGYVTPASLEYP
jgi:hypothetical protein